MKTKNMNFKIIITSLVCAFLLNACSNDLDLTSDWKDIPVVYGLLNKSDANHYIRVEKVFLDPETSAFLLAAEPDSIFYNNISVFLEKNGQEFQLQRVDGNDEGFTKEDGIFATSPNYLYKIDSTTLDLRSGDQVKFILRRGDNLPEVTATTTVLGDMVLKSPNAAVPDPKFSFVYEFNEDVSFTAPSEAVIFDIRLRLNYLEFEKGNVNQTLQNKSVTWIWDKDSKRKNEDDERIKVEVIGEAFFTYLRDNLDVDPTLGRIFDGIDVVITGGGEELSSFIDIKNANTGITSSQELPFYTNISEGRGVFSSRNTLEILDIDLANTTRDSLRHGVFTKDLNFQ